MLRAVLGIGLVSAIFVLSPERKSYVPAVTTHVEPLSHARLQPGLPPAGLSARIEVAAADLASRAAAGGAVEAVRTIAIRPPPIQIDMPPLRR